MSRFHSLKVIDIRKETSDAVSIALEIPEELKKDFSFVQGQYLTFRKELNGQEVRRNYSICSSPMDLEIRVAVKKIEGGLFSSFANKELKVGDYLDTMPPMGNFIAKVNPQQQKNYITIAAGSGITPIMSIVKTILLVEPESTVTLLYGNKGMTSIIFREELEALKNTYIDRFSLYHIFTREKTEFPLFNGRINGDKCVAFSQSLVDFQNADHIYICGPGEMVTSITESLSQLQVDKGKIHFELFTAPGELSGQVAQKAVIQKEFDGENSDVTVILDGIHTTFELAVDGDNILDAALKNGADVPYACKGAVCATCKARVKEGKVGMDLNYSLSEEEVNDGYILTCQAHPITERVVVNFDDAQ